MIANKLPLVDVQVSMNEIPDKIAITLSLGNCRNHCKGCHSQWLSERIHRDLWIPMECVLTRCKQLIRMGADAIVLMGGTNNGLSVDELLSVIEQLSTLGVPVGLYSGLPNKAGFHKALKEKSDLTYLKVGEYNAKLGGLDEKTTNQRFYKNVGKGEWLDMTHLFWNRS